MQLHIANEVIQKLDIAQENRQLSDEEILLRKELKARVLGLAAIERSRRRQSSRITWLRERDACTKFFHLHANARTRKNFIPCLKNEDGQYVWLHEEKEEQIHHISPRSLAHGILDNAHSTGTKLDLTKLNNPDPDALFTEDEIGHAICDMPAEKAPGPDGFTGVLYKSCWAIIKQEVVAAFQCLYNLNAGPLPKLNRASITLLPKKDIAETPGDFRPISLIHSFAKIASKVLTIRLSNDIDKLVSGAQSAFIKKRCIQDNFLYAQNLARAYRRTKKSALLLKLDISKVFDSVSWEYLLELLEKRGFPSRWRNWLALLFASSSSSVRLNGVQGLAIIHEHGLSKATLCHLTCSYLQ